MTIQEINDIEKEVERFKTKLFAVKHRYRTEGDYIFLSGTKETGALRRAALDLKMELTKIT